MCVFAFEILESLYLFLKYLAVIIYIYKMYINAWAAPKVLCVYFPKRMDLSEMLGTRDRSQLERGRQGTVCTLV